MQPCAFAPNFRNDLSVLAVESLTAAGAFQPEGRQSLVPEIERFGEKDKSRVSKIGRMCLPDRPWRGCCCRPRQEKPTGF